MVCCTTVPSTKKKVKEENLFFPPCRYNNDAYFCVIPQNYKHVIQKLQNLQIGAVFVVRMSLMLLAKRDESHLMLWGMKQLLTNRVTTVAAALAQDLTQNTLKLLWPCRAFELSDTRGRSPALTAQWVQHRAQDNELHYREPSAAGRWWGLRSRFSLLNWLPEQGDWCRNQFTDASWFPSICTGSKLIGILVSFSWCVFHM